MDGVVSRGPSPLRERRRQRERGVLRARLERWAPALATLLALVLLAAVAEIVLDGALGPSPLIPRSPEIAGWLRGSASASATASS